VAYHRIVAARAGRAFPLVFEMLADARLNVTTVRLLAPHLTADTHRELLAAASGTSKRQVQELVASRFPQPDVPSSVRALPPVVVPAAVEAVPVPVQRAMSPPVSVPVAEFRIPPPPPRDAITPLAPGRYAVEFTLGATTYEKLQMAQDLLRHAVPSGDTAQVFDRALTALLEDLVRSKFAATDHPRAARTTAPDQSRHIPAQVKRTVWLRDLGRCAFRASGRRCEERGFLEFHHLVPFAMGGAATADNIALRCRAHNSYEAEQVYGPRRGRVADGPTRSGPSSLMAIRPQPPAVSRTTQGGDGS
jgi:hypothetical protein